MDLFKSQVSDSTGQNISALVEASGADDYHPDVEPAVVYAGAVILSIVTGIYIVLLCFFAKRIAIAVRVIQVPHRLCTDDRAGFLLCPDAMDGTRFSCHALSGACAFCSPFRC